MPKQPLPFGDWAPDIALLDNEFAFEAFNVFAGANSYKPIPSLKPFANGALPEQPCRGLTAARTSDGVWHIYAGTQHKLWRWTLAGWADVSRTTGGGYNVPDEERWSFAQFGDQLVACAITETPQVINVATGSNFAALGGSPPIAHSCFQLGDFLFLTGLVDNHRMIQWSGVNDITNWVPGLNLGDQQLFPDSGPVLGMAGGEIGYVVQDQAIRTAQFLPGDTTFIFNFSRVLRNRGAVGEYCFDTVGNVLYFKAEDGFYALSGQQLDPIGQDRVNEWFLANSDLPRRNMIQLLIANKPYLVWAYNSTGGGTAYDQVIIFNWTNRRWTHANMVAQAWATLGNIGIDLDTDDTSDPLDPDLDSATRPLDSFAYVGGRPQACAIDANGFLCTLDGPNMPATMDTSERHLTPGQRSFVSEAYPLIDGLVVGNPLVSNVTVSVAGRERLQENIVWSVEVPLEITGSASILNSDRLHRFRLKVPYGDTWTNAQGLLVDAQPDGAA